MKKPFVDDWEDTKNPSVIYSPSKKVFWNSVEMRVRDRMSAEWAGWVGEGHMLREMCSALKET